jgi:hypothetical protein
MSAKSPRQFNQTARSKDWRSVFPARKSSQILPSTQLIAPLAITNFITDRTKILYLQKKSFKTTSFNSQWSALRNLG